MDDPKSPFEIIEDEPLQEKPKRKRKRKYGPLFGPMPWRLVAVTFIGGILVASIALGSLLVITSSTTAPAVVTSQVSTPLIATRAANDPVYRAAWAGDTMATVSSQFLTAYPGLGNAPLLMQNEGFAQALTVSPDGKQIAVLWSVYARTLADTPDPFQPIDIWDAATGQKIRRIDAHTDINLPSAYGAPNAALAWSPDGRRLASGSRDGKIRVWDAQTGDLVTELPIDGTNATLALSFTDDGQHLAAVVRSGDSPGIDDDLIVWKTQGYQPELRIALGAQEVSRVDFSPDGHVFGLIAYGGGYIELRDTLTGASLGQIQTGSDGTAREFALGSDNLLGVMYFRAGGAATAAGQPTGNHIELQAMRWKRGTSSVLETQTLASKTDYLNLSERANLRFEPDNHWLDYIPATGSTLLRWNLDTGEINPFDL